MYGCKYVHAPTKLWFGGAGGETYVQRYVCALYARTAAERCMYVYVYIYIYIYIWVVVKCLFPKLTLMWL